MPRRRHGVSDSQYSLYILRCGDGSLYTGIALDVAKRLREHETGNRGAKYLRGRGPLRLVFEEPLGNRSAATRIEYQVKRLDRTQKEALISGDTSLASLLCAATGHGGHASGVAAG